MSKEMTAGVSSNLPAYMTEADANLGNENVSSSDVQVPRATLLQAMSPELKKTHSKYIPGAEAGKIAVGDQLYDSVNLMNLYYEKEWTIFDANRRFVATFGSQTEAQNYIEVNGLDPNQNRIVETAKHACLQVNDEGVVMGPVVVLMSSTKLRISQEWNTKIIQTNAPRFGSIWKLGVAEETNPKGTFYNFTIDFVGFPESQETYEFAKTQYELVAPAKAA